MIFYRVENEHLQGPYCSNTNIMSYTVDTCHYDNDYDKYLSDHPTPSRDDLLKDMWYTKFPDGDYEDYVFGFESLDKLFQWFFLKEDIEFLTKYNFSVNIYTTDDCYHGDKQSIARKTSLRLVDSLSFKEA